MTNKKSLLKKITSLSVMMAMALSIISPVGLVASGEDDLPNTYESLGVSAATKQNFEEKMKAETSLPVINVTTKNNNEYILSREVYTECVVDLFNAGDEYELDEVSAGIRVRGNSTSNYGDEEWIKKNTVPYRIKFDSKTNMLGLNDGAKCKSWVLLKSDWDMVKTTTAFRMARSIFGDKAFVSDSRFVVLYVNDKLQGVYVLCEQCQVNKYRVNITEPDEGYTGTDIGYYLELDNYAGTDPTEYYFNMDYEKATVTDIRGETRKFVPSGYTIKNDVYCQEQVDFIDKYLNNVFEILYKAIEKGEYLKFDENYDLVPANYANAKQAISAVMDLESVVDMYLLYEIVHDYDCGEGSFYMCVDFAEGSSVPKLQFTSPWDFNWAYEGSTSRYWAGAFCERAFVASYGDRSNPWFITLVKTDWFRDLCGKKWSEVSSDVKAAIQEEKDVVNADYDDYEKYSNGAVYCVNNVFNYVDSRMTWMDKTFVKPANDVDYEELPLGAEINYQLMNDTVEDFNDVRFVLTADEEYVKNTPYALAYVSVPNIGSSRNIIITKAYRSIIADGQVKTADSGEVFLIVKCGGIPREELDGSVVHFVLGDYDYSCTVNV